MHPRRYISIYAALVLSAQLTMSNSALAESDAKNDGAKNGELPPSVGYSIGHEPDRLRELNNLLLKRYAETRGAIRDSLTPVIVLKGDFIILYRDGVRTEKRFIPNKYSRLKQISHITLGTYSMLARQTNTPLSNEMISKVEELRKAILDARPILADAEFAREIGDDLETVQQKIVDLTISFLSTALEEKVVTGTKLREYARSVAKLDLENAYSAVSAQLTEIDQFLRECRSRMSEDEWKKMFVVIETGHMPRERQSSWQYFSKLLQEKREGHRIVTTESLQSEEAALNLLSTHVLDEQIAVDFFGDPWRMHRDLLSDGARKYLEKHPPMKGFAQTER